MSVTLLHGDFVLELFKNIVDRKIIYNSIGINDDKFNELIEDIENMVSCEGGFDDEDLAHVGYELPMLDIKYFCNCFCCVFEKFDDEHGNNEIYNEMYKYLRDKTRYLYFVRCNKFNEKLFINFFFNVSDAKDFIDKL